MQEEILEKHPEADIRVYAIWLAVLGGDNNSTWPDGVLNDDRVVKFWDGDKIASRFFADHENFAGRVAWDVYYFYGADAVWADGGPGPLVSTGFTIIAQRSELQAAFEEVLLASDSEL